MGFPAVYNRDSKVLILGSFPSVKSRQISFYYGNPQNRFWKMLCGYFQEEIPDSVEGKKSFLLQHGIALWDMVSSCEIIGSSDASIQHEQLVDLEALFQTANVQLILLNGTLAYTLFLKKYEDIGIPYRKMPSTSPANPRYNQDAWYEALHDVL